MEKFLVIQTAFIGDAILTLPMIQILKVMFPQTLIDVLCIPSTKIIFSSSPSVSNIIVIDKKKEHKSLSSLFSFSKEIKKNNYSRIYSPHRSFRTSILIFFTGVKETYGFSNSSLKFVYKNLIKYEPYHHEVQRNLDLIEFAYKNDEWKILPEVKVSQEEKNKVENYLLKNRLYNFITIAPGSIWNTKIYPKKYFEEIVKYLIAKSYQILLMGSEKDLELCNSISEKFTENVYVSAGKFSLVESVEILRRSKMLISNDSAPAHLAMCADIPALIIYCSTIAGFGFYPYNKKSSYLSFDDLPCKPCGIHGYNVCPIETFACGYKLIPGMVIDKIEEMLYDENKKKYIN